MAHCLMVAALTSIFLRGMEAARVYLWVGVGQ